MTTADCTGGLVCDPQTHGCVPPDAGADGAATDASSDGTAGEGGGDGGGDGAVADAASDGTAGEAGGDGGPQADGGDGGNGVDAGAGDAAPFADAGTDGGRPRDGAADGTTDGAADALDEAESGYVEGGGCTCSNHAEPRGGPTSSAGAGGLGLLTLLLGVTRRRSRR